VGVPGVETLVAHERGLIRPQFGLLVSQLGLIRGVQQPRGIGHHLVLFRLQNLRSVMLVQGRLVDTLRIPTFVFQNILADWVSNGDVVFFLSISFFYCAQFMLDFGLVAHAFITLVLNLRFNFMSRKSDFRRRSYIFHGASVNSPPLSR
jgi:hypothetical protein